MKKVIIHVATTKVTVSAIRFMEKEVYGKPQNLQEKYEARNSSCRKVYRFANAEDQRFFSPKMLFNKLVTAYEVVHNCQATVRMGAGEFRIEKV